MSLLLFNVGELSTFNRTLSPTRAVTYAVGGLLLQQLVVTAGSTYLLHFAPTRISDIIKSRPLLHYEIWRYDALNPQKAGLKTFRHRLIRSLFRAVGALCLFKIASLARLQLSLQEGNISGSRSLPSSWSHKVLHYLSTMVSPFSSWAHLYAFTEGLTPSFCSMFGLRLTFRSLEVAEGFLFAERACNALGDIFLAAYSLARNRIDDYQGHKNARRKLRHNPMAAAHREGPTPTPFPLWLDLLEFAQLSFIYSTRVFNRHAPLVRRFANTRWFDWAEEKMTVSLIYLAFKELIAKKLFEYAIHGYLFHNFLINNPLNQEQLIKDVRAHGHEIGFLTLKQRHDWNFKLQTWGQQGNDISLRVASSHVLVLLSTWQSLKEQLGTELLLDTSCLKIDRLSKEEMKPLLAEDPDMVCSICLDGFNGEEDEEEDAEKDEEGGNNSTKLLVRLYPCKHIFHADCVARWMSESVTCPACRQNLDVDKEKEEKNRREGKTSIPAARDDRDDTVGFIMEQKVAIQADVLQAALPAGLINRPGWVSHYYLLNTLYFRAAPQLLASFSPFHKMRMAVSLWSTLWQVLFDTQQPLAQY